MAYTKKPRHTLYEIPYDDGHNPLEMERTSDDTVRITQDQDRILLTARQARDLRDALADLIDDAARNG